MAHGKQPGSVSRILALSPPSCPGAGLRSGQEQQQGSGKQATQQTSCSLKDDSAERLTPPACAVCVCSAPLHQL